MPDRKKHLLFEGFLQNEDYATKRRGRTPHPPERSRLQHGQHLLNQYNGSLDRATSVRTSSETTITEDSGIYIEITSFPDCELPLKSLDTSEFSLKSLHELDSKQIAVIFIKDSNRNKLQKKLTSYLDQNTSRGKPKNRDLIDSIANIKLANLKSFWTDRENLFPEDGDDQVWWELWLNQSGNKAPQEILDSLAHRLGVLVNPNILNFYGVSVALVRASISQLEHSLELISTISELRKPREAPSFFTALSAVDQAEWARNLLDRVNYSENSDGVAASILDFGVNHNHLVLSNFTSQSESETWNPSWPKYDSPLGNVMKQHGSEQAGLILFGDLTHQLASSDRIDIGFRIESGRILPPNANNDPEQYGEITKGTAYKLEINNPQRRRVYSMAVTAPNTGKGGQPTSWSSAVDNFIFGAGESIKRAFIVSAGNNQNLEAFSTVWDQATLSQIEDPAQSWNAITVGSYTDLDQDNDPSYDGWRVMADKGDLAPVTSTSVSWAWRVHAPYKPDVVAEGGNRLISPSNSEIVATDDLSLLTTSGNDYGAAFTTSSDTSASTALVTHIAANLISEYPDFKPETIRGLIVHSAEWTDKMLERKRKLEAQHKRKVAKELILRTYGYGVPNLNKARYSANNILTLVSQNKIQPFIKLEGSPNSDDAKLNQIHFYNLPWPEDALLALPTAAIVRLKVTLSYFVEANPSRRGYRDRFSYQSHGLRFEVKRPTQTFENFKASLNKLSETEDYEGPEGDSDGWVLGSQIRTRGSVHSDTWTGSAADLANMNAIAVYPVGGWWKSSKSSGRWNEIVDYSLIVTIEVADESVDIYSVVESK